MDTRERIEELLDAYPVEIGRYYASRTKSWTICHADLDTLEDSAATRRAWLAAIDDDGDRKAARALLRALARERKAAAAASVPYAYRAAMAALEGPQGEEETL